MINCNLICTPIGYEPIFVQWSILTTWITWAQNLSAWFNSFWCMASSSICYPPPRYRYFTLILFPQTAFMPRGKARNIDPHMDPFQFQKVNNFSFNNILGRKKNVKKFLFPSTNGPPPCKRSSWLRPSSGGRHRKQLSSFRVRFFLPTLFKCHKW